MALGFFRHYAADAAIAWSGGSEPGDEINNAAVRPVRDEVERRVLALLEQLAVQVTNK